MDEALMKNIDAYIADTKKKIEYGVGKKGFVVEINEKIDINDIHNAIEVIVDNVVDQDYSYELIDILLSYYIIKLFTNIPAPMADEDIPDYERCLDICIKLQLKNVLFENSIVVAEYINMLEKNIWRKLEYKKARLTLIPWESLMDGLSEFYEILDTFSEFVDKQQDIDIESLAGQINEVTSKLTLVEEMKKKEK